MDLAIDRNKSWMRVRFAAPNAFEQINEQGVRQWREAQSGDENRIDGKIIPGGWDHEHCELCWKHIGSGGDSEGYVSDAVDWVCIRCYERYIEREDLSFVEGSAYEDGELLSPEHQAAAEIRRRIDYYDLEGIRRMICGGVDANSRNRNGWTPLMIAASRGQKGLVSLLIANGADVNAATPPPHAINALTVAAQGGHFEIAKALIESEAFVRMPGSANGNSLLEHLKTGRGGNDIRIVELLRDAAANTSKS